MANKITHVSADPKIVLLDKFTESLPCKLTPKELLEFGAQLGSITQDINAEEDRQASVKSEMKVRMTELVSCQTQLAAKVTRREEYRDIEVEPQENYHSNEFIVARTDTGEVIRKRPLRPDEYQETLKDKK